MTLKQNERRDIGHRETKSNQIKSNKTKTKKQYIFFKRNK